MTVTAIAGTLLVGVFYYYVFGYTFGKTFPSPAGRSASDVDSDYMV